jgi:hypothetical protein
VDPLVEIEELVDLGRRGPGSDAERRAARHLEGRLRELGRDVEVEPIEVRPAHQLTYAVLAIVSLAGSLVSVSSPAVGVGLGLAALLATLGEATGRLPLARRLTGRRASQNVVSRASADRGATLILAAHYDSGRGGAAFTRRLWGRVPGGTLWPLLAAMLLVAIGCGLRLAGVEGPAVSALQFVPTVGLLLALPLLVDIALTAPTPGANDNASGVATALALAEEVGDGLEHFDLWVLLTGAHEGGGLGMAAWMRRHRKSLDAERAVVLNLDEVGVGEVRYAAREGALAGRAAHPQLLQLCRDIAADDASIGAFDPAPVTLPSRTDAAVARSRGIPAITITCRPAPDHHLQTDVPERIDEGALDRVRGFTRELIERLDAEVGPDLPR